MSPREPAGFTSRGASQVLAPSNADRRRASTGDATPGSHRCHRRSRSLDPARLEPWTHRGQPLQWAWQTQCRHRRRRPPVGPRFTRVPSGWRPSNSLNTASLPTWHSQRGQLENPECPGRRRIGPNLGRRAPCRSMESFAGGRSRRGSPQIHRAAIVSGNQSKGTGERMNAPWTSIRMSTGEDVNCVHADLFEFPQAGRFRFRTCQSGQRLGIGGPMRPICRIKPPPARSAEANRDHRCRLRDAPSSSRASDAPERAAGVARCASRPPG
jgi:hypothetical protein